MKVFSARSWRILLTAETELETESIDRNQAMEILLSKSLRDIKVAFQKAPSSLQLERLRNQTKRIL